MVLDSSHVVAGAVSVGRVATIAVTEGRRPIVSRTILVGVVGSVSVAASVLGVAGSVAIAVGVGRRLVAVT